MKRYGAEIITAGESKRVDLKILMKKIAEREITSVLVEGGGTLNFSLLKAGLVDKVIAFIAPKIFGGAALTAVEGTGFTNLSDAVQLKNIDVSKIGDDIFISGYVNK